MSRMQRVVVIGSHPMAGYSMRRYSQLLADAYCEADFEPILLRPPSVLSKYAKSSRLRKFLIYFESLVIFPIELIVRVRNSDFVHLADHSDAIILNVPGVRANIVTCHDLIAVSAARGELNERRVRWTGRIYQSLVVRGLRSASSIACVTQTTADEVRRLVRPDRVELLQNPIDPALAARSTALDAVLSEKSPFLLVVSSSGWRKRRERAVSIWRAIRSIRSDISLVIVGPSLNSLESAAAGDELGNIRVISTASDRELLSLYRDSLALLQCSRYEGFGWPIVEANSQGTVAICSDIPVFREVGPNNIFVPEDLSQIDWTQILDQVSDEDRKSDCYRDLVRFSWPAFVRAVRVLPGAVDSRNVLSM